MEDSTDQVQSSPVTWSRDGDVGVILINNPPVNAGSREVRAGILTALDELMQETSLCALVVMGAGNTFIAGSDIREFGQPLEVPELPTVISAIEAYPKPVVAALHGAALGGGFELALGCDARIALTGCVVGLPEVTLGMIPGAGGTQRLPRLIPLAQAIELVTSGRRVKAEEACEMGIIASVVETDLRANAVAFARALHGQKRRLRDLPAVASSPSDIRAAEQAALQWTKGRPYAVCAIDMVKAAAHLPIDEALAKERAAFQTFRMSDEAAALRYLFFAERDAGKIDGIGAVKPRSVHEVAVIGAGTMGIGIAVTFADAGYAVTLVDQDEAAVSRANAQVQAIYDRLVAKKRITEAEVQARLTRISTTTQLADVASCDVVIEAIFEDMNIKQELFRKLDAIVKSGAILASNTSYLDLNEIAAATSRPQDIVGLHFFNPAHVMKLLEVVRGVRTSTEALTTALRVGRKLGKSAIVAGVGEGFIGNRGYAAYRRQCEFMLEEGAYPEDIDRALEAFGMAMGPFAVGDMSGLDIAWRMRQRLSTHRDPSVRYVEIPDRLCEMGRFGQKTKAGWYRYEPGERKGRPDPLVHKLIETASAEKGITRALLSADYVVGRALIAMINEAALILSEGVAQRASDIDLAWVHGYGFPGYEGGPLLWATRQPKSRIMALQQDMAAQSGRGYPLGHIEAVLKSAASGV